jgi:hypothetical protein
MSGGASGSVFIDSNLKLCGIYWGGLGFVNSSVFYPSVSTFGNYLDSYI